jgi:hypothetical protein
MPKFKPLISLILDVLIPLFFCLITFIIFAGGFSILISGNEVSATSAYKPMGILLVLFFLKLFVTDFSKNFEKNKILVASTLLIIMLSGEALARVYYSLFVPHDLFWASKNLVLKRVVKRNDNGEKILHGIDTIRISKNKSITFEYIPGVKGHVHKWPQDVLLSINQQGFRDDEEKNHKKNINTFRIVGIGDSLMQGQGVHFKDTYGEVIENELNEKAQINGTKTKFEFINLGVGGYNTTMEVETFFKKGIQFNPDLVIISYAPNDFDLPNFIIEKKNPWTSKKSFAGFYISKSLESFSYTKYGKFLGNTAWRNTKKDLGIWGLEMAMWRNLDYGNPIGAKYEFVPEDYKFMVGKEAYIREMKRLKEKCDALKIPLILSFDLPEEAIVKNRENIAIQTAKDLNIPVIKDYKEVRTFLKGRNASPEFFCVNIKLNDCHPNKFGHLIKGQKLASFIFSNYISSN